MSAAKGPGRRVFVRFTQERYDLFQKWAIEANLSMSDFVAMCAWSGSKVLAPVIAPDAYDQLKMIDQYTRDEMIEAAQEGEVIFYDNLKLFQDNQEAFLQWLSQQQQGDLHNNG